METIIQLNTVVLIATTLSYEKVWFAGCKLTVKNGKVLKPQSTRSYGGLLPMESGEYSWHPFEQDVIEWVYGGGLDWQDHTWVFSEGTFQALEWNKDNTIKKLLDYIVEHCSEYAIVDGWTMKTKHGYYFELKKFPHNCGTEITIIQYGGSLPV